MGGDVQIDRETDLLHINREFTVSIVIVRAFETQVGLLRWKIRLDTGLRPDISVAVRMDQENAKVRDYYLLPWIDVGTEPHVRLGEDNGLYFDAYRYQDLDQLFYLSRRHLLRAAA